GHQHTDGFETNQSIITGFLKVLPPDRFFALPCQDSEWQTNGPNSGKLAFPFLFPSSVELHVLGNLLGSGAFGSVYEARWGAQKCAAKAFFHTPSDLYEREIQKEINALQKLRHRNIIQFYRTHVEDNHIFVLMELAEKGSLSKAINTGLLVWQDKTRIANEIARALEYIHQENVLHRNVKSSNVLLTRHMEAKLADLEMSRSYPL
ncbi:hypothetical protein BGW42_004637, partial [Actinomortierella wolfii]